MVQDIIIACCRVLSSQIVISVKQTHSNGAAREVSTLAGPAVNRLVVVCLRLSGPTIDRHHNVVCATSSHRSDDEEIQTLVVE